jgi:serine/threonine protein kinase
MNLAPGNLLNNRYRIVEILGQGGMGSVYRALDEHLDIEVAVKDNLFQSAEYARQFHREAKIMAQLRHSGLPRVTDHFVLEGQGQYLVMDYIEGEDLRQRMDRLGPLPEEEVVTIGAAICDTLMYLCSRNPPVIHRDIKPGNVRITPQGQIFLVDFGLAKTMHDSQATTSGARAMTPGYSPPEQYGTARTDMRTDIFSLGATLYASLTGSTPEDSFARAMKQADLTPIRVHNSHATKKIAIAIEKAIELQPEDRYQTPEVFKKVLLASATPSRTLSGEYYVAPPPTPDGTGSIESEFQAAIIEAGSSKSSKQSGPSKSPKPPGQRIDQHVDQMDNLGSMPEHINGRRKRTRTTGCLVFSIFMLLFAGIAAVVYRQEPGLTTYVLAQVMPRPNSITTSLSPSSTPTSILTPVSTMFPGPTVSSSAQELPIVDTPISVGSIILPSRAPQISESTHTPPPMPTPVGGGSGQIAYASFVAGSPQIFLIDSDSNNRRQITHIPEGACQPDFSPDGERIVFISPCDTTNDYYPGSSMYIINLDGSGLLPLSTMVGGDFDPAWSPDGKSIAFTSLRNARPQIYLLDLEDNSVEVLSDKFMIDTQPAWSPDGKKILFVAERNDRQDIWVMDADGSDKKIFTHTPNFLDFHPSFSPDGKDVLVTQYLTLNGVPRVVMAPFELDDYVEYQIGKEKRPMRHAVMSPDGFWIAFEGWEIGGKHNIYLITTTGISIHQVTYDENISFDPVWRPITPSGQ